MFHSFCGAWKGATQPPELPVQRNIYNAGAHSRIRLSSCDPNVTVRLFDKARLPLQGASPSSSASGYGRCNRELRELREQVGAAEIAALDQPDATRCYARSDKYWITDPQGIAWETYRSLGEAEIYGTDRKTAESASACCSPAPSTVSVAAVQRPAKKSWAHE
jgi:hypothetical protein